MDEAIVSQIDSDMVNIAAPGREKYQIAGRQLVAGYDRAQEGELRGGSGELHPERTAVEELHQARAVKSLRGAASVPIS